MNTPVILCRPTADADLDWVVALEHDPANEPFITRWPRERHAAALREPGTRHLVICDAVGHGHGAGGDSTDAENGPSDAGEDPAAGPAAAGEGRRLGYVILRGVGEPDRSVELLRIVVAEPGRGVGRAALRLVKQLAFDEYGAHRLWLDVVPMNVGARALYASEGFAEEGVMREAARRAGGFVDLVLMSMLEREWRAGDAR
jgi:diamine N-acetyltransferase